MADIRFSREAIRTFQLWDLYLRQEILLTGNRFGRHGLKTYLSAVVVATLDSLVSIGYQISL